MSETKQTSNETEPAWVLELKLRAREMEAESATKRLQQEKDLRDTQGVTKELTLQDWLDAMEN